MKRRIIKQGNNTLTITLPRKWASQHGINAGEEVEVEERRDSLVIAAGEKPVQETKEIDLSEFDLLIPRVIHALYKKGYDKLALTFTDPKLYPLIQKAMGNETIGYEIVKQGIKHCEIENISEVLRTEFDSTLRRMFLALNSMAQDGLEAVKQSEAQALQAALKLEETNNRLTTFCRRALNKYGCPEEKNLTFLYCIIESLERVADEYKYLYQYLHQHLLSRKKAELSRETIDIWRRVNGQVQTFYHLFYSFEPAKAVALAKERKTIIDDAFRLFDRKPDRKEQMEARVLHHLLIINQEIFNLLGPALAIKV